MTITQFKHPDERITFPVSIVITLAFLFFIPWITLSVIALYGLSLWAWQRWLEKQNLWVNSQEHPEWEKLRNQFAQRLGLVQKPAMMTIDLDHWNHRLAMAVLQGQYIFLSSKPETPESGTQAWSIAWQLGQYAAGHHAWWRKLLIFPSRLIPFYSSYQAKAETQTADRLGRYALDGLPSEEALEGALPYQGKREGVAVRALADAWKEGVLPWLIRHIGPWYNPWPPLEQRKALLGNFDPEAIIAARQEQKLQARLAKEEIHINALKETPNYTPMATNKKINPALATIAGFLAGIPLSYFFQSESLRGKLSVGEYLQELPAIFERAAEDEKYLGIVITLIVACLILAAAGYGLAFILNRR